MYNCVADNPDELTFSEGEVIVVDGEEDQEWWVSVLTSLQLCVDDAHLTFKYKERGNQWGKVSYNLFPFLWLAGCY